MDSIRKEFEAWVKSEWPKTSLNRCDAEYILSVGQYACWEVECCWPSWQAARKSVLVDLPCSYENDRGVMSYYKDEIEQSLSEAGVNSK